MSATPPARISLPPRPAPADLFNSALATDSPTDSPSHAVFPPSNAQGQLPLPKARRKSAARPSFSTSTMGKRSASRRRASRMTVGGMTDVDADDLAPKMPTLVPGIRPAYSTPLPVLPMVVLCIASLLRT